MHAMDRPAPPTSTCCCDSASSRAQGQSCSGVRQQEHLRSAQRASVVVSAEYTWTPGGLVKAGDRIVQASTAKIYMLPWCSAQGCSCFQSIRHH